MYFFDKMYENPQCMKLKIRQLLTISGKMKRSHKENRKLIFLVCFEKKKHLNNIKEGSKLITKIGQLFIPNFDPRDELYPSLVCSQCRNILSKVQDKENVILPIPFDFSTISATKLAKTKDFCHCLICIKPDKSSLPGAVKTSSNTGRPIINHQQALPPAKAITVCQRCKNIIGK